MFTGIVQDLGTVRSCEMRSGEMRLGIHAPQLDLSHCRIGDSICVQGVCLTVVELQDKTVAADVSRETLALTTLGNLKPGSQVNLEPALRAGDALGGHLVSGHVDGVAQVADLTPEAQSLRVRIAVPRDLARYIARKGSVALDGVSLTVNTVENTVFSVNLIPHTLTVTTLGALKTGDYVNLEVDQIARYVERLMGTIDVFSADRRLGGNDYGH